MVILLFDTSDPARTDVTTESTLAYTVLGKDAKLGDFVAKTSPEDRALYVEWAEKSTTLFKEKKSNTRHTVVKRLSLIYAYKGNMNQYY